MLSKAIDYICELNWLLIEILTEQNIEHQVSTLENLPQQIFQENCQSTSVKACQGFSSVINTHCKGSGPHKQLHFELYELFIWKWKLYSFTKHIFTEKKVKIRQTPKPCNKIYGFVQNGTITVLVVTLWQRKSRTQKLLHVCLKKYNSITFLWKIKSNDILPDLLKDEVCDRFLFAH